MPLKHKAEAEEEKESLVDFITRTVHDVFVDNIPMDAIKELPTKYMYLFGFIAELASLVLFAYFVQDGYRQGIEAKFISLDPNSGNCYHVKKSVSGTYTADENGTWVGHEGFSYSRGLYELGLVDATVTNEEYRAIMMLAEQQTQLLGNLSTSFDLATNLLVYMSWQLVCSEEEYPFCAAYKGNTFTFTADAQYMLALSHVDLTISNQAADCDAYSLSEYDLANAKNAGEYNTEQFLDNPNCSTAVNPISLGYDATLDGDSFKVRMDVRTLVSSISVNFNLLFLDGLEVVAEAPTSFYRHNNYTYFGAYYVDPWYPGMEPMLCIRNTALGVSSGLPGGAEGDNINFTSEWPGGVGQLCFFGVGNITGLPLFMHWGAGGAAGNPTSPLPCDCSGTYGKSEECDAFNFISGFMFFEPKSMESTVSTWLDIVVKHGSAFNVNRAAYNASWAAAASTYYPNVDMTIYDPQWRENAYKFCNTAKDGSCSLSVFNSYGSSVFDQAIDKYMYLVPNGSCAKQFSIEPEAFNRLIVGAPIPLVENYYECTLTEFNAMFNAIGIASGNVAVAIPLFVFALLPLMYLWLTISGNVQAKNRYDKSEKESALELLAVQLLRIRDGRTRGMKRDGELFRIAQELVVAAKHGDGEYPDSDDSDDEDEGGGDRAGIDKDVEGGGRKGGGGGGGSGSRTGYRDSDVGGGRDSVSSTKSGRSRAYNPAAARFLDEERIHRPPAVEQHHHRQRGANSAGRSRPHHRPRRLVDSDDEEGGEVGVVGDEDVYGDYGDDPMRLSTAPAQEPTVLMQRKHDTVVQRRTIVGPGPADGEHAKEWTEEYVGEETPTTSSAGGMLSHVGGAAGVARDSEGERPSNCSVTINIPTAQSAAEARRVSVSLASAASASASATASAPDASDNPMHASQVDVSRGNRMLSPPAAAESRKATRREPGDMYEL